MTMKIIALSLVLGALASSQVSARGVSGHHGGAREGMVHPNLERDARGDIAERRDLLDGGVGDVGLGDGDVNVDVTTPMGTDPALQID